MPFRTYCDAHSVPSTGPLDFLMSLHHRDAESTADEGFAFSLAAGRRQNLFSAIQKDPTIASEALPFWQPLISLEQLADIATDLGGNGEKQLDSFIRGQLFSAAAGMNPSLPWDD
eukprot:2976475-Rhodomonas_salina.1